MLRTFLSLWMLSTHLTLHCVNLSKILEASQNIGVQKVAITDEYIGVSQLLGHVPVPQVYAYIPQFQFQFIRSNSNDETTNERQT